MEQRNIIIRNINAKLSNPKIKQEIWIKYTEKSYEMKCLTPWCSNLMTPFNFHIGFIVPLNIRTSENIDKNNLIPLCRRCSNEMNNKINFKEWCNKYPPLIFSIKVSEKEQTRNKNTLPVEIKREVKSRVDKIPEIKKTSYDENILPIEDKNQGILVSRYKNQVVKSRVKIPEIKEDIFIPKMDIIPNVLSYSDYKVQKIPSRKQDMKIQSQESLNRFKKLVSVFNIFK